MKLKYVLLIAVGLTCFNHNSFANPQYSQGQIEMLKQEADRGDKLSQTVLGEIYQSGEFGIEKGPFQAKEWYEKAILQGSPEAMNNLSNMYANGDGVPQDIGKAIELRKRAYTVLAMQLQRITLV